MQSKDGLQDVGGNTVEERVKKFVHEDYKRLLMTSIGATGTAGLDFGWYKDGRFGNTDPSSAFHNVTVLCASLTTRHGEYIFAAPRQKKPARACLSQCMSHVSRLVPGDHPLLPGYTDPNRNRRKFCSPEL
eukprot:scaffold1294_cov78-Cylindrotheca_fusiformis.AAC.5